MLRRRFMGSSNGAATSDMFVDLATFLQDVSIYPEGCYYGFYMNQDAELFPYSSWYIIDDKHKTIPDNVIAEYAACIIIKYNGNSVLAYNLKLFNDYDYSIINQMVTRGDSYTNTGMLGWDTYRTNGVSGAGSILSYYDEYISGDLSTTRGILKYHEDAILFGDPGFGFLNSGTIMDNLNNLNSVYQQITNGEAQWYVPYAGALLIAAYWVDDFFWKWGKLRSLNTDIYDTTEGPFWTWHEYSNNQGWGVTLGGYASIKTITTSMCGLYVTVPE